MIKCRNIRFSHAHILQTKISADSLGLIGKDSGTVSSFEIQPKHMLASGHLLFLRSLM